jgi:hypothetical protein
LQHHNPPRKQGIFPGFPLLTRRVLMSTKCRILKKAKALNSYSA